MKRYLHSSSAFSLAAACHILRYWYPQVTDCGREELIRLLCVKLQHFEQNSTDDIHYEEEANNDSLQLFHDIQSVVRHLSCGMGLKQKYSNTILSDSLTELCKQGIQAYERGDNQKVSCILFEIYSTYSSYFQELNAEDILKEIEGNNSSEVKESLLNAVLWRIVNYLNNYHFHRAELILQSQIVIVCSIILAQNVAQLDENDHFILREEQLILPDKLTPYLLGMMNGLRYSPCVYLQQLSASTLAFTCQLLVKKDKKKAVAKVVENLFNYLMEALKVESGTGKNSQKEGILFAWKEICRVFSSNLLSSLPRIDELSLQVLENLPETLENSPVKLQHALQFLKYTFKFWDASLTRRCNEAVEKLTWLCGLRYNVSNVDILNTATDALSEMIFCCQDFLVHVVRHLLPILDVNHKMERTEESILYALKAIRNVVLKLGNEMIPCVSLFLMPLVSRMTHQNCEIRIIASETFGLLLRLLPLENDSTQLDKWLYNPEWQSQRERAQSFIHQLLGWKARDPYNLPVELEGNVQLREYQRQGLEWLAFLNRYGLHGLLCDDMGLGKTLMTLCIIVGDTLEWSKCGFQKRSLVVAPSSVTAHWFHETKRFFGSSLSNVILYADVAKKRKKWLTYFDSSSLIITSYEIVSRGTIQYLF